MKSIKTIGVLTSGGDAPGMNAAIRAVTRAAISKGFKVKGIYRGFDGLIANDIKPFTTENVSGIIMHGGTILKTARSKEFMTKEGQDKAYENMQKEICKKVGRQAKKAGAKKNWQKEQTLYWQGKKYKRDSIEYQELLDRAFLELSKNSGFRKALLATKNANLTHSIGKKKTSETILTKKEFTSRLMKIREILKEELT